MSERAGSGLYGSSRLAASYARERPPLHRPIVQRLADDLGLTSPVPMALDIGCGAGLSTAALEPFARTVIGIDPFPGMLMHARTAVPRAAFVMAQAERLPFGDRLFTLITAAGAINYTDRGQSLPEAARVLTSGGTIVVYDFAAGRLGDSPALETWHQAFRQRYPRPPGYSLDVQQVDYASAGLRLDRFETFDVPIAMTGDGYLRYAMSGTGVASAIANGVSEAEIRGWCGASLGAVFEDRAPEVLFAAYTAHLKRSAP